MISAFIGRVRLVCLICSLHLAAVMYAARPHATTALDSLLNIYDT